MLLPITCSGSLETGEGWKKTLWSLLWCRLEGVPLCPSLYCTQCLCVHFCKLKLTDQVVKPCHAQSLKTPMGAVSLKVQV